MTLKWTLTRLLAAAAGVFMSAAASSAQSCPPPDGSSPAASASSVLHGTLRYHPGTRGWLGLVLDRPACGQNEVELAFGSSSAFRHAKRMRNCAVTVAGKISEGLTAYYSAALDLFDPTITAAADCHLLPPDPDYENAKIPDSVSEYRATVSIDAEANLPLSGKVVSVGAASLSLTPWQAYAKYSLNGEEDLDLGCAEGFIMTSFTSVPESSSEPSPLSGWARLDSSELGPASLTIECRRK